MSVNAFHELVDGVLSAIALIATIMRSVPYTGAECFSNDEKTASWLHCQRGHVSSSCIHPLGGPNLRYSFPKRGWLARFL